ncbi:MAG: GNAT family N-acetyltransferase [Catenulispora sp.]
MNPAREVRLRPVIDADLPVLFEHQRDPAAARMAATTALSRGEHAEMWQSLHADPGALGRTIVVDDVVAGALTSWERWDQRQVGYCLGREYWGRGIATTALALFLGQMTIRPVHAYVAAHNLASRRVLDKCGFRPGGTGTGGTAGDSEGALLGYVLGITLAERIGPVPRPPAAR